MPRWCTPPTGPGSPAARRSGRPGHSTGWSGTPKDPYMTWGAPWPRDSTWANPTASAQPGSPRAGSRCVGPLRLLERPRVHGVDTSHGFRRARPGVRAAVHYSRPCRGRIRPRTPPPAPLRASRTTVTPHDSLRLSARAPDTRPTPGTGSVAAAGAPRTGPGTLPPGVPRFTSGRQDRGLAAGSGRPGAAPRSTRAGVPSRTAARTGSSPTCTP